MGVIVSPSGAFKIPARGQVASRIGVRHPRQRVGGRRDAVLHRVGDIQCAVLAESHAGRTEHQRVGVGLFGEAGRDGHVREHMRRPLARLREADGEAHDRAPVDHLTRLGRLVVGGDGPVEHVGDEQRGLVALVVRGHVPRAIDVGCGMDIMSTTKRAAYVYPVH